MEDHEATMSDREVNLLRSMTETTWRFYVWVGFLFSVALVGLYAYTEQLRLGLIVTGLRDQIFWGNYIINFVFFISISIAGTLISAVLRLANAGWRRPITRMAEIITVVSLFVAAPLIAIDMGRPERVLNLLLYGRVQSPLLWDFLAVTTYLMGCLIFFYLPMVPDLAVLAVRPELPAWRRRLYRAMSSGWKGTPSQVHKLESCISIMAVALLPLAVATHTVLAWIFSMTLRPGWNSSIFGPYFVIGAIYAGCACVILSMYVLRRLLHLEDYLNASHFRNLGFLLLTFSMLYAYFNMSEYLTIGYKLEHSEKALVHRLLMGEEAPLFWGVHILGVIAPVGLLAAVLLGKRYREFTIQAVALASTLTVVGAWGKRYLIVVPTLESPFLPAQGLPWEWVHYRPTWIEWAITAAAFATFLLIYTVLAKLFPVVSIWETRAKEEEAMERNREPVVPAVRSRPYMPPPLSVVLLTAAIGMAAISAQAQQSPANPKASNAKPAVLSMDWESLPAGEPEAASSEAMADGPGKGRVYFYVDQALASLFSGGKSGESEYATRSLAISAKLRDENGAPLAYRPVGFALQTSFGHLLFGKVPTDEEGRAKLVLRDRRCGTYPVQAVFDGDQSFRPTSLITKVDFGVCPAPALPAGGVFITPYATMTLAMACVFFFGTMWSVYFYVGYLFLGRVMTDAGEGSDDLRA